MPLRLKVTAQPIILMQDDEGNYDGSVEIPDNVVAVALEGYTPNYEQASVHVLAVTVDDEEDDVPRAELPDSAESD